MKHLRGIDGSVRRNAHVGKKSRTRKRIEGQIRANAARKALAHSRERW